jgi:hypothetical protein
MGHSYSLTVVKLLFAMARTCAYSSCTTPLVFEDPDRGVRSVAVEMAHIRSPKSDGPRHDPTFPADRLNSDENLLLLCKHHHTQSMTTIPSSPWTSCWRGSRHSSPQVAAFQSGTRTLPTWPPASKRSGTGIREPAECCLTVQAVTSSGDVCAR